MSISKTAVITGSTGGIGGEIATLLAAEGWDLALINRSSDKSESQRRGLGAAFPDVDVRAYHADLTQITQIREAAEEVRTAHPRIDALYNVSGVLASSPSIGRSGHDAHYAVNVLAGYVLTQLLRPALVRGEGEAPTMVSTMSSSAIKAVKWLDVAQLSRPEQFGLFGAYAASKMALTIMGTAMADGLRRDNILIRSVDPGPTRTSMTAGGDGMPLVLRWLAPLLFSPPDKQAAKVVFATDPERFDGRTGILVANRKEQPLPSLVTDPDVQAALMDKLERDAA
ncbi:MAG: SDR family NAD(P)-dependent oxidoreductase [Pseudomonadota bacterium]